MCGRAALGKSAQKKTPHSQSRPISDCAGHIPKPRESHARSLDSQFFSGTYVIVSDHCKPNTALRKFSRNFRTFLAGCRNKLLKKCCRWTSNQGSFAGNPDSILPSRRAIDNPLKVPFLAIALRYFLIAPGAPLRYLSARRNEILDRAWNPMESQ